MFDYDENCSRTYLSKNGQKLCAGPALRNEGTSAPKPGDECPHDPNKTARGLCGCGVREPLDVAGYRDAQDYPCSDWAGFDCTRAAEQYGYTAAEEVSILENCGGSCNICPK